MSAERYHYLKKSPPSASVDQEARVERASSLALLPRSGLDSRVALRRKPYNVDPETCQKRAKVRVASLQALETIGGGRRADDNAHVWRSTQRGPRGEILKCDVVVAAVTTSKQQQAFATAPLLSSMSANLSAFADA